MEMAFENLDSAYRWLDAQIDHERNLSQLRYNDATFALAGFRERLRALGDPHLGLRTIHIAGTRGKGSAALALEALLRASGLRTATYTSPHLREYRERIRIDGEPLAGEEFARLLARVAQHPGAAAREEGYFKTVFENLTALFFLAAHEMKVDWAIVETGLGGRLD